MYYLGRSLDCCTNSFPVDLVAPGIRPLPPPPFFCSRKVWSSLTLKELLRFPPSWTLQPTCVLSQSDISSSSGTNMWWWGGGCFHPCRPGHLQRRGGGKAVCSSRSCNSSVIIKAVTAHPSFYSYRGCCVCGWRKPLCFMGCWNDYLNVFPPTLRNRKKEACTNFPGFFHTDPFFATIHHGACVST